MLKIIDQITLARTKFRTRRIRLVISLVVISALSAVVASGFWAIENSIKSIEKFSEKGLSSRFLAVVARKTDYVFGIINETPDEIFDRAKKLYQEDNKKLAQEAKKKGEDFIPNPADNPISEYGSGFEKVRSLNQSSKFAEQAILEYIEKHFPKTPESRVIAKIKSYNPKGIFEVAPHFHDGRMTLNNPNKSAVEVIRNKKNDESELYGGFSSAIFHKTEVTQAFHLDNFTLEKGEIPLIVDYGTAGKILKQEFSGQKTPQEFYQYIQKIRAQINKNPIQICYRNTAEIEKLTEAYHANQDKDSKVKYDFPNGCGGLTIKSDKRSQAEKRAFEKEENLRKSQADYVAPLRQELKFRIIGVAPESTPRVWGGLEGLIYSLVTPGISGGNAFIPREIFEQNADSETKKLFEIIDPRLKFDFFSSNDKSYFVEFDSAEELNNFINSANCQEKYCADFMMTVSEYPNNSRSLKEFKEFFQNVLKVLAGAVAILTIIVIYVVVNRIMVDSRRETAVFRAIGYSRFEISQIYIAYVAIYSMICAILAIFSNIISGEIEKNASLYFSALFSLKEVENFEILNFNPEILLIFVPIFAIGLLASLLPLIINTRRSPLKNLRLE